MSTITLHPEGNELAFDGDTLLENWRLSTDNGVFTLSVYNNFSDDSYVVKVAPVAQDGTEGAWKAQIFATIEEAAAYLRASGFGQGAVDAADDLLLLA